MLQLVGWRVGGSVCERDGKGQQVLVEKTIALHAGLDPQSEPFIYETFRICDAPANRRDPVPAGNATPRRASIHF